MAIDPATQKICEGIGNLRSEIKNLTHQIENLAHCKNDHENRIRDMEMTRITREEHNKLIDKLEVIQISLAKNIAYVAVIFTIIVIVIQYAFDMK